MTGPQEPPHNQPYAGPTPYGQPTYSQPMHAPPPAPKKHNNPVLWIIFAVIVIPILFCGGCFALIGNSSSSSSSHKSTTSTPARSVTPVYTSVYTPPALTTAKKALTDEEVADAAYILALDSERIHYSTKASAIKLAHTVCDALQEGVSAFAAGTAIAANSPYTMSEAGYITGAAISAYCPEFK
ncbi:DUF732 domain-containing protein [Nocardia sp. NPDC059239]|uniref:DUF732 domain-containing protein n=1 Tax=Nocardia sp. NPDC059239 TaxID=3346785 RepID=UPI0036B8E49D